MPSPRRPGSCDTASEHARPLPCAVAALAPAAVPTPPPAAEPAHRRAARYAWAVLLARIYELLVPA